MGFSDYNSNPDLNTSISGVNIGEGCPPSGINNAIRQIMADAKTADGGYVKNTGSQTVSGTVTYKGNAVFSSEATFSSGANVSGGLSVNGDATINARVSAGSFVATSYYALHRDRNDDWLTVYGGKSTAEGAYVTLTGSEYANNPGRFTLVAVDSAQSCSLAGYPNGKLTWGGMDVITNGSNQTISGTKTFKNGAVVSGGLTVSSGATVSGGIVIEGTTAAHGVVYVYPTTITEAPGWVLDPGTSLMDGNATLKSLNADRATYKTVLTVNKANGSATFSGTVAGGSDERIKSGISSISEKTLDAWSKVDWRQFRYKADGAGAPMHFGVVAQNVSACLAKGGIHVANYAVVENLGLRGEDGAKDEWSVYYQEAFALEAAYQRRRADKAEARIAALEQRLDELEAAIATLGA